MPFLKLSEADRERLGAPEELSIDLAGITNREAIRLRTLGYNTPRLWRSALRGKPVDEDGNPATGEAIADYVMDYQAWTCLLWLALKRVGIESDPATLEFDLDGMSYEADPEPEAAEPGKAEESEPSET